MTTDAELRIAAARYVLDAIASWELSALASRLVDRGLTTRAVVDLATLREPIMAEAGPLFERILEAQDVTVPSKDDVIEWIVDMDRHDRAYGPISQALADDHRRLETLLDGATARAGQIDRALFEQFRAGLLRHIGVEEKILLPAARRVRGSPLPVAQQLRLDHGAIAAMLVPTPTPALVLRLRALLDVHDALEEGPGGVYEACDALLAGEATQLLREIHDYPAVRTAPHHDGPLVEQHIVESLNRAGR